MTNHDYKSLNIKQIFDMYYYRRKRLNFLLYWQYNNIILTNEIDSILYS